MQVRKEKAMPLVPPFQDRSSVGPAALQDKARSPQGKITMPAERVDSARGPAEVESAVDVALARRS